MLQETIQFVFTYRSLRYRSYIVLPHLCPCFKNIDAYLINCFQFLLLFAKNHCFSFLVDLSLISFLVFNSVFFICGAIIIVNTCHNLYFPLWHRICYFRCVCSDFQCWGCDFGWVYCDEGFHEVCLRGLCARKRRLASRCCSLTSILFLSQWEHGCSAPRRLRGRDFCTYTRAGLHSVV